MKHFSALAAGCSLLVLAPVQARTDVISDWNNVLLQAIRNESTSPPLAARNLAIVHVAMFEAVNAIERQYQPYFLPLNAPEQVSPDAAAVGAAYACLSDLYPSQMAAFDAALSSSLAAIPPGPDRDEGFTLGQAAAILVLAWRVDDGASTSVPYVPSTEPGAWRRTAPFFRPPEMPQWPYVVPFAMTNGAQFRPPGPPPLSSTQYTRDFNLVKDLGKLNSTNRTAEQTLIARFWSDFSYTVTPPGHWNQIAQNVITNRPFSLVESARLFALLNIAMADAGIASWDAKYAYNFWRPITAIQQAELDGNPDTEADPNWTPLLNTPPFPEYTSGHSTFSAAAARVLADFCGTDHVTFTVGSDTLPTVFRTYHSFAETADEIGWSRIYGGIHFLSADLDGLDTGRKIGRFVMENLFLPLPPVLAVVRDAQGIPRVSVSGRGNRLAVLETTTNLSDWVPLRTNAVPFDWTPDEPRTSGARFFRVRLKED